MKTHDEAAVQHVQEVTFPAEGLAGARPQCVALPQSTGTILQSSHAEDLGLRGFLKAQCRQWARLASARSDLAKARPPPGRRCRRHPGPDLGRLSKHWADRSQGRRAAADFFDGVEAAAAFQLLTTAGGLDLLPLAFSQKSASENEETP